MKSCTSKSIVILILAFSMLSCFESSKRSENTTLSDASSPTDDLPISDSSPEQSLKTARDRLVYQATKMKACSEDNECTSLAAGHRACGGPSTYVVYSKSAAGTELEDLKKYAAAYSKAQRSNNSAKGMTSICSILEPPHIHKCSENICVGLTNRIADQSGEVVIGPYLEDISSPTQP